MAKHHKTHVQIHHDGSMTKHRHHTDGSTRSSAHANLDHLHDTMQDDHGMPNPGEAAADGGAHGIPPAMAEPAGIPAGPAAAAPGGGQPQTSQMAGAGV